MKPLLIASLLLAAPLASRAADPYPRLSLLGQLVRDPSPQVRVEAVRSLARIPSADAAALALGVLDLPMDPTLDYALWLTINELSGPWIAALQDGSWDPSGRERQLEFALRAIPPAEASRVLSQVLADRPLDRAGSGPWIELIGAAGSPSELEPVYARVLDGGFDEPAAVRALRALGEAARLRKVRPDGDPARLATLFAEPEPVALAAVRLAGQWKDIGAAFARLGELAGAGATPPAVRTAALGALRQIGGPGALETLARLGAADRPAAVRRQAAAALAALDLGRAVPLIAELAPGLDTEPVALDFWRSVLGVKGAGQAIAAALPASGIPEAAARAGMRAAREGGRSDLDLVEALARGAGLAAGSAEFTETLLRDLAAQALASGDTARGEMIYRRTDLACVSCHAIGGVGGRVGPDMTSIGASAPADYLVESLLLPNAKIKEGYHAVEVTTRDGSEFIGTLARETPQELFLRNAAGAEQAIAKTDITRREQGTQSLMPAGLIDNLPEQERLDLLAFLSRLGKPGDFDASQGGVARRWHVYNLTHTDQQHGQEGRIWSQPFADKMWNRVDALVSGRLTRPLLEEASRRQFWVGVLGVYAGTEIEVARAGAVAFDLSGDGAELWIGGRRIGGPGTLRVDLPAGRHRLLVRLDPRTVPDTLTLRSPDASFLLD